MTERKREVKILLSKVPLLLQLFHSFYYNSFFSFFKKYYQIPFFSMNLEIKNKFLL